MNVADITLFKHEGIEVELQNTLLNQIRHDVIQSSLPAFERSRTGRHQKVVFSLIAAYTRRVVSGFDWQPPTMRDTPDDILVSFEQFYTLGNAALINAWSKAVDDMIAPIVESAQGNPTPEPIPSAQTG